jgi:hypothetical protein
MAIIDNNEIKRFLEKRKDVKASNIAEREALTVAATMSMPVPVRKAETASQLVEQHVISAVNAHVLPAMEQQLKLKAYSSATIKTYLNEVGIFLKTIRNHAADEFTVERIKDYLLYCAQN